MRTDMETVALFRKWLEAKKSGRLVHFRGCRCTPAAGFCTGHVMVPELREVWPDLVREAPVT